MGREDYFSGSGNKSASPIQSRLSLSVKSIQLLAQFIYLLARKLILKNQKTLFIKLSDNLFTEGSERSFRAWPVKPDIHGVSFHLSHRTCFIR